VFGWWVHQVMRSWRLPGTKMMPSERTMLPSIMDCVAGLVTSLAVKPSAHRYDLGFEI